MVNAAGFSVRIDYGQTQQVIAGFPNPIPLPQGQQNLLPVLNPVPQRNFLLSGVDAAFRFGNSLCGRVVGVATAASFTYFVYFSYNIGNCLKSHSNYLRTAKEVSFCYEGIDYALIPFIICYASMCIGIRRYWH